MISIDDGKTEAQKTFMRKNFPDKVCNIYGHTARIISRRTLQKRVFRFRDMYIKVIFPTRLEKISHSNPTEVGLSYPVSGGQSDKLGLIIAAR